MSNALLSALNALVSTNSSPSDGENSDFETTLNSNIIKCLEMQNLTFNDVSESVIFNDLNYIVCEQDSVQWRFLAVISHTLLSLVESTKNVTDHTMSVNCKKCIKSSLQFIVSMGILPNLIPGIGVPLEKRTEFAHFYKKENTAILEKYTRLKTMCDLLTELCKESEVKTIIYTHCLSDYLAVLFQLCYAPIMKPDVSKTNKSLEFIMNDELYAQLQMDQSNYRIILDFVLSKTYQPMIMKELIILQGCKDPDPPFFMKRELSKALSNILISKDGILCVMRCFFDDDTIDIGNQWKQIDIAKRLVSVKHGTISIEEYLKNICIQIRNIILSCNKKDYVIVAAACVANLNEKYPKNEYVLDAINSIVKPFLFNDHSVIGPLLLSSNEVRKTVKILDLCFNTPKLCLSPEFLTPIVHTIFSLRVFCTSVDPLKFEIDNIFIRYFQSKCYSSEKLFDTLMFMEDNKDITVNKNVSYETKPDGVQVNCTTNGCNVNVGVAINCILELIDDHPDKKDLSLSFYVYCLTKLLTMNGKKSNKDLLIHEDETHDLISKSSENLLILLKALEKLSTMDSILNSLKENPNLIVKFIIQFINDYSIDSADKSNIINNECVVICLTLITVLLSNSSDSDMLKLTLQPIEHPLKKIIDNNSDVAVVFLCKEISNIMTQKGFQNTSKTNSEFDQAVVEVCDSLLPVRAHGLMHLTKLLEKKDAETVSKKHYVQCMFEQNLKSDDSYIYLTAINGLAAMANLSTDEILEVLTREFLDDKNASKDITVDKEENVQIRMKIGEVLVKVTKALGELAPTHKALLLNTFLVGCKDKDDLLRASSLSNLAEVCRVLSYKLGPVLYELLNCIDSIIQTDKSLECRRASVLVVSSLLKGLGKEALYFLRETLLPIYRTLKKLYNNEAEDSTVRLHAQIGLEELNSIVRGVLFPPLKMEKQIFVLDKPNFL